MTVHQHSVVIGLFSYIYKFRYTKTALDHVWLSSVCSACCCPVCWPADCRMSVAIAWQCYTSASTAQASRRSDDTDVIHTIQTSSQKSITAGVTPVVGNWTSCIRGHCWRPQANHSRQWTK